MGEAGVAAVDGRKVEKYQVAPARAKLQLAFQRASRQVAGVVEAASAAEHPNGVDSEEA